MNSQQDKIRSALKRLIDDRGVDMASVSKAIGKNHAYIQQYLTRGVPAELGYKTALALSDYFGCGLEIFGIRAGKPVSNDARPHPLVSIRKLTGLKTSEFARALGEKESDLKNIEDGKNQLTEKLLLKICRTFHIDPEDLAEYAPAMSADERVMLLRFRQLTPGQRKAMETLFRKFEKERA